MKGSDIIKIIGVDQIHCSVSKEMITLDPEHDYAIFKGTESHPKVVSDEHVALIEKGKYPRLHLEGKEVVFDVAWATGHNAFEGDVEPKLSPERDKLFFIQ
ncbi:MAG: hypothetical protein NTY09_13985 [bacterium]|nr:hypothetical protein [bacterium]